MKLRDVLLGTEVAEIAGDAETEVTGLAYDSIRVEPGTLFFCVRGARADGHDFAAGAVERGASALVVERPLELPVAQARVSDARAAMAPAAVRFWSDPTAELRVAGVTGTNGKTTTAFLIRHLLETAGTPTGLLGTVKQRRRRRRGAGRAHHPRGDRPAARPSGACSRPATAPVPWRSPRTPSPSSGPPGSASRSPCSRT